MKHGLMGVVLAAVSSLAAATSQTYVVLGTQSMGSSIDLWDNSGFLSVWGPGNAYAEPRVRIGDPFHYVVSEALDGTRSALEPYSSATMTLQYDPNAVPYAVTPTSARYLASDMGLRMAGENVPPASMASVDNRMSVVMPSNGWQTITFYSSSAAPAPLPGATFSYPSVAAVHPVDLVQLLGAGAYVRGFDLSAFSALPVRLTAPTNFVADGLNIAMTRGGALGLSLPETLDQTVWQGGVYMSANFYGAYTVAVDPADYADGDAYAVATAWVQSNIQHIYYEQGTTFQATSITAVPEPGASTLALVGLVVVLARARRRATA